MGKMRNLSSLIPSLTECYGLNVVFPLALMLKFNPHYELLKKMVTVGLFEKQLGLCLQECIHPVTPLMAHIDVGYF